MNNVSWGGWVGVRTYQNCQNHLFSSGTFRERFWTEYKCFTQRFAKRQYRYLSCNHKPVNFWLKSTSPPPQQLPLGLISSLMWTILGKMSTLLLGVEFPMGRGEGRLWEATFASPTVVPAMPRPLFVTTNVNWGRKETHFSYCP